MTNIKSDTTEFDYDNKAVKLYLPSGSGNVVRTIKKGRFYEQKMLEYIRSLNLEGNYLDVGANIGNHTVYFGLFTPSDKVYSIEANPSVVAVFKKNIQLNKLSKKVRLFNVAAGKQSGTGGLSIVASDEVGGTQIVEGDDIPIKSIDSLGLKDVSVVKMDIEGYEMEALKGMRDLIQRYEPEMFIEVTTNDDYKNTLGFLRQYGYHHVKTYNNSATAHFSTKIKAEKFSNFKSLYPIRRVLRAS